MILQAILQRSVGSWNRISLDKNINAFLQFNLRIYILVLYFCSVFYFLKEFCDMLYESCLTSLNWWYKYKNYYYDIGSPWVYKNNINNHWNTI